VHELTRETGNEQEEDHVRNPLQGRNVVRPGGEEVRGSQGREQPSQQRRSASAEIRRGKHAQYEWQQRGLRA
jgi:hypothetical protein